MGHMKAIRSNTRPSTRPTTKENDNNNEIKNKDDGSVPILLPPRTQLERQKDHHIAFSLIDLSKEKELKGLISTDLPGCSRKRNISEGLVVESRVGTVSNL